METAAAREGKCLATNRSPVHDDLRPRLLQIRCIQHHDRPAGTGLCGLEKSSAHPSVVEADVIRVLVLEMPSENIAIKTFGRGQVRSRKLNVIDTMVIFGLAHSHCPH